MKFELTAAERLSILMMAEQCEQLGATKDIDPNIIKAAIYSKNEWALTWAFPGIFDDMAFDNPQHVSLTVDILDMWSFIEESYEGLSSAGKAELRERLGSRRELPPVFPGFDGNNEHKYMSAAEFLVEYLERFTTMGSRAYSNSHCKSIPRYSYMLEKFKLIRPNLGRRLMNVDELETLLS